MIEHIDMCNLLARHQWQGVKKAKGMDAEAAGQGDFGVVGDVTKVIGTKLEISQSGGLLPITADCSNVVEWQQSMQPRKTLQPQNLTRTLKVNLLTDCGLLTVGGEILELVPSTGKFNTSSLHLDLWSHFVVEQLKATGVAVLSPELTNICLNGLGGGETEDPTRTQIRKEHLLQMHREATLTLAGVHCDGHWSLLAIEKKDGLQVRWRDSLTNEPESSRTEGLKLLQFLEPTCTELPPRCNRAVQVVGSAACGFFVANWIEQEVRHLGGESFCSMGWPSAGTNPAKNVNLREVVAGRGNKTTCRTCKKKLPKLQPRLPKKFKRKPKAHRPFRP